MNQEFRTVRLQKCNRFYEKVSRKGWSIVTSGLLASYLALVDFHLCDGLPSVHRHKPGIILPPAAQIQDQLRLVSAKSCKYRLQSLEGEFARGEEE